MQGKRLIAGAKEGRGGGGGGSRLESYENDY